MHICKLACSYQCFCCVSGSDCACKEMQGYERSICKVHSCFAKNSTARRPEREICPAPWKGRRNIFSVGWKAAIEYWIFYCVALGMLCYFRCTASERGSGNMLHTWKINVQIVREMFTDIKIKWLRNSSWFENGELEDLVARWYDMEKLFPIFRRRGRFTRSYSRKIYFTFFM